MDKTSHVYLLLGPEIGQKTEFIGQLYEQVYRADPSVEQYKFYPYDSRINDIINIIQTPGLFWAKRFLHLSNVEDFDALQMEQLIHVCGNLSPDVWVIMSSNLTHPAKIHRKLESIVPEKNKRVFWEMFENRKQEWIHAFFQKENLRILPEAVDRLLSLVENNTQELGIACEALAGYFHKKDVISEDDISQFIVHSREESVYSLFSYIVSSDLAAACESLNSLALSSEGVGVQTLTRLLWQFRRLMRFKELMQEGTALEVAARQSMILGKHQTDLYKTAAQKFNIEALREILERFANCDTILRLNYPKNIQKTIIETFLVSLCDQQANIK